MLEAREGDLELRLRAVVERRAAASSTSPAARRQHAGNLNCPLAVTRSACLFAVRVLTDPDIPPTAGAYRPIEVRAPQGSAAERRAPARPSRRATSRPPRAWPTSCSPRSARAQGQGTMNNLTLGDERFSYYETLGGGQGACADADGPSGVHVAMSNTLNTPIEALEREFPLRVLEYALRRGSGGAGRHRGGDGVVRELEALRDDDVLADRRAPPPRAARGGGRRAGCAAGATCSTARRCPARRRARSQAGQRLRIETPGGGGFGDAARSR